MNFLKKALLFFIYCLIALLIAFVFYYFVSYKDKLKNNSLNNKQKYVISLDDLYSKNTVKEDDFVIISSSESEKIDIKEVLLHKEKKDNAKISIIIVGLGMSQEVVDQALSLPKEVAFGYSSYFVNESLNQDILDSGRDIYINLPFEPNNYPINDPGYLGILRNARDDNVNKLNVILNKISKIKGVYTDNDEKFSLNRDDFSTIMDQIVNKHLIFLYGNGKNNSPAFLDGSDNVIFRDVIIDQELNSEKIRANLMLLESIAIKQGYALGYIRAYPISLKIVNDWIVDLDKKGIELVSVSGLKGKK